MGRYGGFSVAATGLQVGQFVTATATHSKGNASEFARNLAVSQDATIVYAADAFGRGATDNWGAALVSWGIALFEYLLQVPANRIGFSVMSLGQLKILQEVITLLVFVPFAIFYMDQKLTLNYLYAGLCLVGAVYFIFRA